MPKANACALSHEKDLIDDFFLQIEFIVRNNNDKRHKMKGNVILFVNVNCVEVKCVTKSNYLNNSHFIHILRLCSVWNHISISIVQQFPGHDKNCVGYDTFFIEMLTYKF
jgi:hypothetical protein